MIRPIYELKCRKLNESGGTAEYHWRVSTFWFWENPLTWVNEQMAGMGQRIVMDSLRKVR